MGMVIGTYVYCMYAGVNNNLKKFHLGVGILFMRKAKQYSWTRISKD